MSDFFDDELAELEARVHSRASGQIRDLRLSLHDDGVVLRGRTRSYHAKQMAQQAILEATRRPIRANEIEVV